MQHIATAPTCSEKSPWTRARRWMLFLIMGTLLIILYQSTTEMSWPLNLWRTDPCNNTICHPPLPEQVAQCFVAYPHPYHFILDQPHRCGQERPFLVLMIPVAPHNRDARDVIRNTWGRDATVLGKVVSYYFLLGVSRQENGSDVREEQLLEESRQHEDLIQSDFLDSYNNLTIKTMVMFQWLSSHCPNTSYAMKIDSDIFLNVRNLVSMLLTAPRHQYLTGNVARGSGVLRDPSSKWFMPESVFPEPEYPPYALGLGYVFSMDLPAMILEASLHVRALYIEDVYVGLCMEHLGIDLTDSPFGLFMQAEPYFPSNCFWTSVITTLLRDSEHLRDVWTKYQSQVQKDC